MAINCARPLGSLLLLIACLSLVSAQENTVVSSDIPASSLQAGNRTWSSLTLSDDPATIVARFVEAETRGRQALNQHTFKRDVVLQTIGPNGEVTGEYVRNSQFLFDDSGRRIERVLFHPPSTIRVMRITKEDIQDLAGSQLLGIDIVEANKYHLTYAGLEVVDSHQLYAIDVTPTTKPNPNRMRERFFVGRVWIDPVSFQIVKVKGVVEPQGKQRFPVFVTWREPSNGDFAFPVRTEADDVLRFPTGDVHYRIKVNYYDYKLFGSKVTITEIDDPTSTSVVVPPAPKAKSSGETCVTNRNAPPVSPYHWPADVDVKVYTIRNMFTSEQLQALRDALKTWTTAGREAGSGVTFAYAGETENLVNCRSCLTVRKREVFKNDGQHYSFFNPLSAEEGRVLLSAWIDLDFATTNPQALQGFVAHELGHGMGLWDCETCKKKRTIMNGFPDINKDNGLIAPSRCDLETLKGVYVQERQIAATRAFDGPDRRLNHAQKALVPSETDPDKSSSLLNLQLREGSQSPWWSILPR
jgi:hypothetical protein